MNYAQMRRIIEHPHLKGEANFAVLMVLAYHANDEGRAWPSKPTIMREARVSERTADSVVARLAKAGYFTIERGGGSKNPNVYLLHVERGGVVEMPQKGEKPRSSCGVSGGEDSPVSAPQTPQQLRGLEGKPREKYGVSAAEPREKYGVNGAPPIRRSSFINGIEGGGGVRAGAREGAREATPPPTTPQANSAPPPPRAVADSPLQPTPDDDVAVALIAICGVNVRAPSARDVAHWPAALEVARRLSATPEQLHAFREDWLSTPTASGQPKRNLYLSNVAAHLPQFLQTKPEVKSNAQSTQRPTTRERRHAERVEIRQRYAERFGD